MKTELASEKSKVDMEKRLEEITATIREVKYRMEEINNNYQKSKSKNYSKSLEESYIIEEMYLDGLIEEKSEIEVRLMVKMAQEVMKSKYTPEILRLFPISDNRGLIFSLILITTSALVLFGIISYFFW